MPEQTEELPGLRSFRSQVRAVQRAMKQLGKAAGDDISRLDEIMTLDGEWIEWIKNDIEPRFHD